MPILRIIFKYKVSFETENCIPVTVDFIGIVPNDLLIVDLLCILKVFICSYY